MATIEDLLQYGKQQLEQSGNEYAKYERKVLLEEVLGCNYMYMLMNKDEIVEPFEEEKYKELLAKRCEHYPLQYLLGYAHFMDYTFVVNESVLIPRNDTEILVENVLEWMDKADIKERTFHKVLDLCCGSGCIGISLKCYQNSIDLTLSDVSQDALLVAKENCKRHGVEAKQICSNLYDNLEGQRYHIIVSNPPYIESEVIKTLMPEVKDYEPMLALDGGQDGLDFYRVIIGEAPKHLEEDGCLFLEIGYNQSEEVTALMKGAGFLDIQVKKDYAGLDRVVYGHL